MEAYEKALMLLRVLEFGQLQIQQGKTTPAAVVFQRLRERLKKRAKAESSQKRSKKS
jgi:hypothetical protein